MSLACHLFKLKNVFLKRNKKSLKEKLFDIYLEENTTATGNAQVKSSKI